MGCACTDRLSNEVDQKMDVKITRVGLAGLSTTHHPEERQVESSEFRIDVCIVTRRSKVDYSNISKNVPVSNIIIERLLFIA